MIGKELGKYRIMREIGRGGMGIIYEALQASLNRTVALKVLPREMAFDVDFIEAFHHEAELAASLNHPNIVQIYDNGEFEGIHFIAMEFVKGTNLKKIIQSFAPGPLSFELFRQYARQMLLGMDHAHRKGVIHRDIKPQNMLVTEDGVLKISDFGIAQKIGDAKGKKRRGVAGTVKYISPEQARGSSLLDERADIYSLGVVLYEMATGVPPFDDSDPLKIAHLHVYAVPRRPSLVNPEIPQPLEQMLLKTLQKKEKDRYQTVGELLTDIMDPAAYEPPRVAIASEEPPVVLPEPIPVAVVEPRTPPVAAVAMGPEEENDIPPDSGKVPLQATDAAAQEVAASASVELDSDHGPKRGYHRRKQMVLAIAMLLIIFFTYSYWPHAASDHPVKFSGTPVTDYTASKIAQSPSPKPLPRTQRQSNPPPQVEKIPANTNQTMIVQEESIPVPAVAAKNRLEIFVTVQETGEPINHAEIYLDGQPVGVSDESGRSSVADLSVGQSYALSAKAAGYKESERIAKVIDENNPNTLTLSCEINSEATFLVQLAARPYFDALYIDGVLVAESAATWADSLTGGRHVVKFFNKNENFMIKRSYFVQAGRPNTFTVDFTAEEFGILRVPRSSDGQEQIWANVRIDGREWPDPQTGQTPFKAKLTPGTYRISLHHDDVSIRFSPPDTTIQISPGREERIPFLIKK